MTPRKIGSRRTIAQRIEEIQRENAHLRSLLLTDRLTGLANERFFYLQLEVEAARTRCTGQSFTLIMIGLEDFQSIRETLGSDVADRILLHLGGIIWKHIGPTDFACHLEAGRFSIIMPAVTLSEGIHTAKRIQHSLATPAPPVYPVAGKRLSACFGLITYTASSGMSVDDVLLQAEEALDAARKGGNNKISCSGTEKAPKAVTEAEKTAIFKFTAQSR